MSAAPALDPAHTALLVMDYQPAILAVLPEDGNRKALLDRMEGAIADVRTNGGTIAYVRVGFTDADWDAIPAAIGDMLGVNGSVRSKREPQQERPEAWAVRYAPSLADALIVKLDEDLATRTPLREGAG
ncbi:hypothetical protein ACFV8Z_27520 [Streptomyces sp. NPDC059837]|uniref:hypothetical protein n=2 Tax=Streptomyces TaxID=1883 RepID=UPI003657E009